MLSIFFMLNSPPPFHSPLLPPLSSIDVVTSNCVVNLSPDKRQVLREVARVLKTGGELYFSDIFADRRIPLHLQQDRVRGGSWDCCSDLCVAGCDCE